MPGSPEYDIPGFLYAGLITFGGVMGYLKKGSLASLIAGGASGVLAGWGAYRASYNPKDVRVSFFVALILTGLMGKRFIASGKFMPAGLVAILSILMAVRYGMRLK